MLGEEDTKHVPHLKQVGELTLDYYHSKPMHTSTYAHTHTHTHTCTHTHTHTHLPLSPVCRFEEGSSRVNGGKLICVGPDSDPRVVGDAEQVVHQLQGEGTLFLHTTLDFLLDKNKANYSRSFCTDTPTCFIVHTVSSH